jgi:S1-C subfamily serine protease
MLVLAFFLWGATLPVAPPEVPSEVQKAIPATLRLKDAAAKSTGSGAVIGVKDAYAYVLTACHVISQDPQIVTETFKPDRLPKLDSTIEGGDVVFRNVEADLAIVRIAAGRREWATIAIAPALPKDASVPTAWVAGCDDGGVPRITAVTITDKKLVRRPDGGTGFFWQAKGEAVPGRSGGPLLDKDGRLIGICSGAQGGQCYYTHLDEIRAGLKASRVSWLLDDKGHN